MNVTIVDLEHPDADEAILAAWRQAWLAHPSPPLFCHPDWLVPWWRTLCRPAGGRPRLVLACDDSRLVAAAPLQVQRSPLGLTTLRNAGTGVSDYTDWLLPADPANRDEAVSAMFEHLAAADDWIGFTLDGVTESAALLAALPAIDHLPLSVAALPGLPCPYVELRGSFEDLLATMPGRFRYNLRSRERRLAGLGRVELRHATPDEAPRFVEDAIRLHGRRWRGQYTSTVFSASPAGRAFYRATLPSLVEQGLADLASLSLNGDVVATSVGLVHDGRYAYYMPAWDPAYHVYAPSTLLLAHLIERAYELGLREFDFMLGDEEYKRQWSSSARSVTTLLVARGNAAGRLWLETRRAAHGLRERARRSGRLRWLRRSGVGALRRSMGGE